MTDQLTHPVSTEVEVGPVVPQLPSHDEVVVRRNGVVSLVVACVAALMSAAYLARGVENGSAPDWAFCVVLALLTWFHLFTFLDSRVPLLVADTHGVRIRLGRTWRGMSWEDIEEVEHLPRRGPLRDGKLVLFPRDPGLELVMLGPTGRRHARISQALHGAPFALPLGLTTRVLGGRSDLCESLAALSDGRCQIVEVRPDAPALDSVEPVEDAADEPPPPVPEDDDPVGLVATPTPEPAREPLAAVRRDVLRDPVDPDATQAIAVAGGPFAEPATIAPVAHLETEVIHDVASIPAVTPVIGPVLAVARQRLHLDVDQLAERTRIRPHVIEAIEIDDFAPCGGDFYARGHLRTLARVLGVDVAPLLETYDETYADAPIDPRRVFEAELATGRTGPIRGTKGGPNWSVLVAAVMTVVLGWSVARLVMDDPSRITPNQPSLADGSAGLASAQTHASPVPVVLSAAGGGAHVVVRDGNGKVVFTGSLAFGQSRTLQVAPPVRIQSTDGSLRVTVDGQDKGALGRTGQPAQAVFTGR